MIMEFHERVDHLSLGEPDLRYKRLSTYMTVNNYLAQNNIDFDEIQEVEADLEEDKKTNYYDIVNIKLCNRIIREIYYFEHESGYDDDTLQAKFACYISLLREVMCIIHKHIYPKIMRHSTKCAVTSVVHIAEEDKLSSLLYDWMMMELKVMDYLFYLIETNFETGYFNITKDIYNTRTTFIEVNSCGNSDFISRDDAKQFLLELDSMEQYFVPATSHMVECESRQQQTKKTFQSICEIRKHIHDLFDPINPYIDSDSDSEEEASD